MIQLTQEQIMMEDCNIATRFDIVTRKGSASGLYVNDRIWVHHISGNGSVKGIMQVLINNFKTNKITFTPLINDNIKNSIKGEIKICKADSPDNPYREDFEYMECIWK